MDPLNLDIIAALQIAPRVPITALAETLDERASLIAKHLKKMQQESVVRVIGRYSWPLIGTGNPLQVRIRCRPGRTYDVAEKLKELPEIQFLAATSGSMDISVDLYPLLGSDVNELIHSRIPSIPGIESAQSALILKCPLVGQSWRLSRLTPGQRAELSGFADRVTREGFSNIHELSDLEFRTFQELGRNARSSAAGISRKLGVSYSSAYRTIQTLLSSGAISPRIEVEPALVGFPLHAIIALQVEPNAILAALATLSAHPAARMVAMVAGTASVTFDGAFATANALADFITDDVGGLGGARALDICIATRVYRRYWMDREGGRIREQIEGVVRR